MAGGCVVPKILVADDNSNIQKMVGLALKDQGIDVVAVGNGEAAVRKIADVRPDLVLADVFMPVRNGYEVCQFVKMDSALSHIPVILLVAPAEDSSFTTAGSPFTMEHDWRDRDSEEVAEEEEEQPSAWRREGAGDQEEVPAANAGKSKSKSSVGDWRTGGFEQMAAGKSGTPAVPGAPVQEPRPVSNKPPAAELWAPPVPPPAASSFPAVSSQRHSAETATAVVEDKAKTTAGPAPDGDGKDGKGSWFSVSSSPWEGEIQKANQLASTWDAPTVAN